MGSGSASRIEDRTRCDGVSIIISFMPLSVRSLSKIAHISPQDSSSQRGRKSSQKSNEALRVQSPDCDELDFAAAEGPNAACRTLTALPLRFAFPLHSSFILTVALARH